MGEAQHKKPWVCISDTSPKAQPTQALLDVLHLFVQAPCFGHLKGEVALHIVPLKKNTVVRISFANTNNTKNPNWHEPLLWDEFVQKWTTFLSYMKRMAPSERLWMVSKGTFFPQQIILCAENEENAHTCGQILLDTRKPLTQMLEA